MRFFFDRSAVIGLAKIVRAIDEKKYQIVHHDEDERFHETTPDVEWMQVISRDDPAWIIISGDGRILKNKVEKQVLTETGLLFFCLDSAWQMARIYDCGWKFLKIWPTIVETAKKPKSKIYRIHGGSSLKIEPM
jgi:PIN like domain